MPKKINRSSGDAPRSVVKDPRFSSMHSAPIFKKTQKDSKKITVDERFQKVLTDDRFRAVPGAIDIYGRKAKKGAKSAAEKELDSFYQIDNSAAIPDEETGITTDSTAAKNKGKTSNTKGKGADSSKGDEAETRLEYLNRLARGDVSGSDSDDSSDSEEERFSDVDSDDSDQDAVATDESTGKKQRGPLDIPEDEYEEEDEEGEEGHATCRLAILNCDWDSLKAQDLMSVLQSFCPAGKTVDKVTVYPSDFGKEKMAEEATHGPPKIWAGNELLSDDEEDSDDDENDENEGYDGIEAIDQEETPADKIKVDKWKRANATKALKKAAEDVKEKLSKADRKGDFKRLPGTVGLVLQDDLVTRGLNRADDADEDEQEEGEEEEGANRFDGDLSKSSRNDDKGRKGKPVVKGKDKKNTIERERFTGAGKGDVDGEGGFDEVALRAYELSKLKYYFAVAELASVEAAEALMAELDGVELGHSSMVFDLRFIPDDTSFHARDIRDNCTEVGADYQPPDFIVNALQHTTVQCSWDEGEKDRERKLTNISQWRQLQESELLQYIASSDSDDDDDEEEEKGDSDSDSNGITSEETKTKTGKGKGKVGGKKSAADLRRSLGLGSGDDDDEFEEDSDSDDGRDSDRFKAKPQGKKAKDDVEEGFDDDFFMDKEDGEEEGNDSDNNDDDSSAEEVIEPVKETKGKKGKAKDDKEDMTFTYIPDAKKQSKDKKRDDDEHLDETPFEKMQRQLTEKRKARKAAKKLLKGGATEEIEEQEKDSSTKKLTGKGKKRQEEEREAASKAELELLLSDDDEGYDMRALQKEEKDRLKGPKGKRKRGKKPKEGDDLANSKDSTSASGGDFELDLQDGRFSRMMEGDSSFGIDRTSSDFKETKAMKQILAEQRDRREKESIKSEGNREKGQQKAVVVEVAEGSADNVDSLVSKLKRKYAEQNNGKPKQPRL